MSETLSLQKKHQSKFTKKVKSVKDKVNKGVVKIRDNIKNQRTKKLYGLIYVGHIPHGFYEDEMREYFKQFGAVTNVRVCRSRKTGQSKGYGFVEFLHPEVAEVAAETMDNYLMFNRRLICKYIPPEKQRKYMFTKIQWSVKSYPLKISRQNHISKKNENPSENKLKETTKITLKKFKKKMDKLAAIGIEHTFIPSNVPDDMKHLIAAENNDEQVETIRESKLKKIIKESAKSVVRANQGLASKSLRNIVMKKDKMKKILPKMSFMESDRLKRLAANEILNESVVKKVKKLRTV